MLNYQRVKQNTGRYGSVAFHETLETQRQLHSAADPGSSLKWSLGCDPDPWCSPIELT